MSTKNGGKELPRVSSIAATVPEAAALLGLSRDLGYDAALDGSLPTVRLGKRRRIVPLGALSELSGLSVEEVRAELTKLRSQGS